MRRIYGLALALLMVLLLGCGSRTTLVRKNYLIESDARVDVKLLAVPEPFLVTAYISPVQIAEPYKEQRIAIRRESHELIYYLYHFWADKPAEMATALIADVVEQAQLFRSITRSSSVPSDVMVSTRLTVLERVKDSQGEAVHVAGIFELNYLPSRTPLISYPFERQVRLRKDKTMNGFARLLSKALFDEAEEFVFRMADYYQYPPD